MSASLVGSEMCIRDRLLGRACRGALGAGGSQALAATELRSADEPCVLPCLLYTSDAADDM
eukprot:14308058-Alexandrium_andersonii.AAC.1